MMSIGKCILLLSCCLFITLPLSGCAREKSFVVLLPEDSGITGEITIVNVHGAQQLKQPWQSVELPEADKPPGNPVVVDEAAVEAVFGEVLSGMPVLPVHHNLFFMLDSVELVPDSQPILAEIVKAVNARQPAELIVVGHTDTMGSDEYNLDLGLLRANAVSGLLKSLGAAPAIIETSSRGKADLLVDTADQTPEPRNRRAEITVR
jgi:outer membrane protein OmpA-like peptidoglycan-associated protein